MPRGRHRHSPPLHRLLPSSVIAGVSVVCALGPWVFSEVTLVRVTAAIAALTAVAGAVVMRRWDAEAGRQVADLTRARAGDEWRFEERVAELEADLEESRELRTKLEQRLRAKHTELARLRNEHASLLRRYATAETERASALEGRRLLEIESTEPSGTLALPPAPTAESELSEEELTESSETETAVAGTAVDSDSDSDAESESRAVFSSEGARLYLRAAGALARFGRNASAEAEAEPVESAEFVESEAAEPVSVTSESAETVPAETALAETPAAETPAAEAVPAEPEAVAKGVEGDRVPEAVTDGPVASPAEDAAQSAQSAHFAQESEGPEAAGMAEVAEVTEIAEEVAVVAPPAAPARSQGRQPAGHFTVPTAVAVVPAAPARRPFVEGGFDFFGTQKESAPGDAVRNEDLAGGVGQEALALHKAGNEAGFKPVRAGALGVGQVIDLTAHDETEQIDVQRLRGAAS
ncbi:hypothetical protein OIB37_20715 [Streptomyces sp. NBC_00820]|uniref:hypothetical protein n=1 Tax=Streptomyces sp. NBC_00820 TaxID=2975842 RepID=UPI002ED6B289|nr:hypothetical protein OIB37_20715 [Streptomyces sp. NBC_00820]